MRRAAATGFLAATHGLRTDAQVFACRGALDTGICHHVARRGGTGANGGRRFATGRRAIDRRIDYVAVARL